MTKSACKQFYCGLSSIGGLGFFSALSHTQFLDDMVIQREDQLKEKGKVFFSEFPSLSALAPSVCFAMTA